MEAYGQVKGRKYPHVHGGPVEADNLLECTKCGKKLPLDRFHQDSNGKPVQPCISCALEQQREQHVNTTMKTCSKCGKTKPLKDFPKADDIHYRSNCRACHRDLVRKQKKEDE